MLNEQKGHTRMQKQILQDIQCLQAEKGEEETAEENLETRIRVGGDIYLDVQFEVVREIKDEDMDRRVNYSFQDQNFMGITLRELQSLLFKQASGYLQTQTDSVSSHKQALDQMFEGRTKRPTGPQIAHKQFEQGFTWHEEPETVPTCSR